MKAKFIRKYYGSGHERNFVFMDYEYRGREYTVYINTAKGNEPLSWQHKSEQARIDRLIELEEIESKQAQKPYRYEDTVEYALDLFLNMVGN